MVASKRQTNKGQASMFPTRVPTMPEGYYSGDQPNQNLRAFVERHMAEHPYDPATDDYDVPAFDKPITTTKATAIYNMHTYWSKKPHDAIREYIRHYTRPGALVLDPFCGSGGTALAAMMEDRVAVAIDRSPAATFITKNYCTPLDVNELQKAFEELRGKVQSELDWLYETRCDRCDGKAKTVSTVYSQVFQCSRCMTKVPLFDCIQIEHQTVAGKLKAINTCPTCHTRGVVEEISTRGQRFGAIPVLVNYTCETGCKPARGERRYNDPSVRKRTYFDKHDIGKVREIENMQIPYWYPQHKMMNVEDDTKPWGVEWRPGRNFRNVADLFTKRNLWALATLLDACRSLQENTGLLFAFESNILSATIMQQYREKGGGFSKGTYYIPQIFIEREQFGCFSRKLNDIVAGQLQIQRELRISSVQISNVNVMVSTENRTRLSTIPANSIDYIFTEPPYGGTYQYGELNFVWEAWLKLDTRWHPEEIIVNEVRGKGEDDWATMMRHAMSECYRVLKPGRWLSLCYHDASGGTWELVQDIMAETGFLADTTASALFIDTGQKTYNQLTADKVTKRDLVINFRKPKAGEVTAIIEITGDEDAATFNEKVHVIIRDYLTANPGSTKDRVYDEVVSRMVRAGRMEAHNFEELLAQVADEVREPVKVNLFDNAPPDLFGMHETSRWYLKETEADIIDAAESAKEDAAAKKLRSFIAGRLSAYPELDGVHYSDLFEHYVYTVKDKPRREFSEWLLDYFYKTTAGSYRLPASPEEEQAKAQGRAQGTNRRIKRYLAYLQQGVAVPEKERPRDATLAEWIRQCRRSGLYEQGIILYERGGLDLDHLVEEVMVDVEEDYEVCKRMLARTQAASIPKRKGGKAARSAGEQERLL